MGRTMAPNSVPVALVSLRIKPFHKGQMALDRVVQERHLLGFGAQGQTIKPCVLLNGAHLHPSLLLLLIVIWARSPASAVSLTARA